jgi:hypothetical protein
MWRSGKLPRVWGDLLHDLGNLIVSYMLVLVASWVWEFIKFWNQSELESITGEPETPYYEALVIVGRIRDCVAGFYQKYGPEPDTNQPQAHSDWRIQFRPHFRASLEQPVRDLILKLQAEGTETMLKGTYALNKLAVLDSPGQAVELATNIYALGLRLSLKCRRPEARG